MNMVITMGGLGSRFRKAGYKMPKYMLEVRGKSLFAWSMSSLQSFFQERFIFLVRKEDEAIGFIEEQCRELGIRDYAVQELDHLTRGQAETAMLAKKQWRADEPVFVYNIDTYVEPGCLRPECIKGEGFLPCFHAEGSHWSFVRLDEQGRAVEVREKQRISDNCTIGAYYFASAALYADIYQRYYADEARLEAGERYIAPLYNLMIEEGHEVCIQDIDARYVHVLGTPEEVALFEGEKSL